LFAILSSAAEPFVDPFTFLSLTGLRSSELCWLLKDDVQLTEKPCVLIHNKECPITGTKWWPKQRKNRIIPLCPQAATIARKAFATSPGPWLFWAGKSKGSPTGRFTPRQLRTGLQAARKAGSVYGGVVHTFRHVFCSFLANNKVPPLKVMKILGHGSLEMVLRYYHLPDEELFDSLNEVDFRRLVGPDARMPEVCSELSAAIPENRANG
jgi:integrase